MKWGVSLVATIMGAAMLVIPSPALADYPPPPAVGETILEDPLAGASLIQPYSCRTQRGGSDFVGEGLRFRATGPCTDGDFVTGIAAYIRGLTMLDGEVRVDAKAVSGLDHVRIGIDARVQPRTPGAITSAAAVPPAHAVVIEPGRGQAFGGVAGQPVETFVRQETTGIVPSDDWNTMAIRLEGPNVWLLVNDQVILHFTDETIDQGGVFFDMVRVGDGPRPVVTDPNDTTEVAVVFRNLRVSALAEGDPVRVPVYQRP